MAIIVMPFQGILEVSSYFNSGGMPVPAVKGFDKSDLNSLNEVELRQYNSLRDWRNDLTLSYQFNSA